MKKYFLAAFTFALLFGLNCFAQTGNAPQKNTSQQTVLTGDSTTQTVYSSDFKKLYYASKGQPAVYTPDSTALKKINANNSNTTDNTQNNSTKNNGSTNTTNTTGNTNGSAPKQQDAQKPK